MTVKLISVTPDAEKTWHTVASVSNPANQENEKLCWTACKYCIKHQSLVCSLSRLL
jgi:thymidylate synthase (FAD)